MPDALANRTAGDGSIVIWGSAQSGKTSLLTALLRAAYDELAPGWAITARGVDTQHWADEIVAEFRGMGPTKRFEFPRRTRPEELQKVRRFDVIVPRQNRGMFGTLLSGLGLDRRRGTLKFLDASGEFFDSPRILLDQTRVPDAQQHLAEFAPVVAAEIRNARGLLITLPLVVELDCEAEFTRAFHRALRAIEVLSELREDHPLTIPVAVCLTKADSLSESEARATQPVLDRYLGTLAQNAVRRNCDFSRFFVATSVGWLPDGRPNVEKKSEEDINADPEVREFRPIGPPSPVGVMEPVQWLIDR